ncbi:23S rRNA (adenine(2030)-N(6))-methyltransferase RlmJ [Phaeovibrio sulfidiphilus]|uniref:Ribosomal RNA large subunit methyltransferase J n=1 Tax=Phaeovibrio sulfidiphilus TaxID=1220600 RepID=A0A8J6YZ64_9PROT|nr:23S rRNA (adenine(2030)-N(6))-methyltransferase RlmJ [Phaeovibrio sulfidiphilus]MBE1237253.1 23S rRNA (adenine(2030)-N(6))-methyltransferase RlmJ [Phaeovibrio sulfidiphilus]
MNYDHTFHAGNFADVLKHACLVLSLQALGEKEKPYFVLDTHGGQGRFDLASDKAGRTAEAEAGVLRLMTAARSGGFPESLRPYLDVVTRLGAAGETLRAYPGSPLIARTLMRANDRLWVAERHPVFFRALRALLGRAPNTRIEETDGYAFLKASLPPAERRGLVLIDPPFEKKDEFETLARFLAQALRRWKIGRYLIWFPIKNEDAVLAFQEKAFGFGVPALMARLRILPETAPGMGETGLLALNPPFALQKALPEILPFLAECLGQDGAGTWSLEEHLLGDAPAGA